MRYYLIVGEASGDLHASHLMRALQRHDPDADFRFFGGDNMTAVGGTCVMHYRHLAYMGFVPVLTHLHVIVRNMAMCKRDIAAWQPDVVILVDYPGFNLGIARFVKSNTRIPVFYYISPKIWAWKEYRIKNIRRDVDRMFSILPFEVPFYEHRHNYPIHYVGNPTADEVRAFRQTYDRTERQFCTANGIDCDDRPLIALLPGSRRQEIKDNLPAMIDACSLLGTGCRCVIAAAPAIDGGYYDKVIGRCRCRPAKAEPTATAQACLKIAADSSVYMVTDATFALLSHAKAALVTSGTATLETSLFGVPQVVCYKTPLPRLIRIAFNHVIKVPYISLVNLIGGREIVPELMADLFSTDNIRNRLRDILPGGSERDAMISGYDDVRRCLGDDVAPDNAARLMTGILTGSAGTKPV